MRCILSIYFLQVSQYFIPLNLGVTFNSYHSTVIWHGGRRDYTEALEWVIECTYCLVVGLPWQTYTTTWTTRSLTESFAMFCFDISTSTSEDRQILNVFVLGPVSYTSKPDRSHISKKFLRMLLPASEINKCNYQKGLPVFIPVALQLALVFR